MNVLITGANRGVGLELVKQFLASGDRVFGMCRAPESADNLLSLQTANPTQLSITQLDVADPQSIGVAYSHICAKTDSLDILINNAGVLHRPETFGELDIKIMRHSLDVNAIAPMLVAETFMPLLKNGTNARLMSVTSQLGSLTLVGKRKTGLLSYNASKAALNMYMRMLSHDLPEVCVAVIHPGWVRTDMGGEGADISAEESATGIANVVRGLTISDTNKFFIYDGEEHDW